MKIALISEHASPLAVAGGVDSGGQNIYVANVARQLVEMGHQVDVFTRRDRALLPERVDMDGVRVIHVPAGPPRQLPKERLLPFMDEFAAFLSAFFRREPQSYDVMHANFFMSGFAALQVKAALGVPLVTTFHALGRVRRIHQGTDDGFPDERFAIEDELVAGSDVLVAECPQDQADLLEHYRADPARIQIVPCGFDAEEFMPVEREAARDALGWRQHDFIVLQLGRLVPRKGIDNVVRGVGVLKHTFNAAARLYVVGGNSDAPNEIATPEIARLREIARECGVAEQTSFVGRRGRTRLRYFYSAADVFVTTPWYEPFGITPIEAMACATPVIGADVGGIRYSILDGVTGFLVPPRDPHALAARLDRLRRDPALARRMGEAGLDRARTGFTWRGVSDALAQIYARAARLAPTKTSLDTASEPAQLPLRAAAGASSR
ncbi:glycosyltransferase involved in cell wall biosynthesis [Paraburkholderia sp. HC6.4b]|uniref:glycosyltransferase family 4 protein n=1 Tax=unclassified Paraburkholderia TaxID=2615204 RepID=UPI00160FEAEF|nr:MULTISPECIES: glycosyltransferase family 1 protein [unclassified Paraburkholderia]MBB5407751.1 glycosyltransferase involved in cell wall biosynthesis [Paraburkholderia sp. HC6.4b]MBB5452236.1 glycosyltransferase involved in cell wall biosynthesis [Paraburkholderia sp. Kb1A]